MNTRILVADNHPVILLAVKIMLEKSSKSPVVDTASTWSDLLSASRNEIYSAMVTDLCMTTSDSSKGASNIQALRSIAEENPMTPIVVYTATNSAVALCQVLQSGIKGLVLKADPIQDVVKALEVVLADRLYVSKKASDAIRRLAPASGSQPELSPREGDVLSYVAAGMKVGDIASLLGRSPKTVSTQKITAMQKLGLRSDFEVYDYFLNGSESDA